MIVWDPHGSCTRRFRVSKSAIESPLWANVSTDGGPPRRALALPHVHSSPSWTRSGLHSAHHATVTAASPNPNSFDARAGAGLAMTEGESREAAEGAASIVRPLRDCGAQPAGTHRHEASCARTNCRPPAPPAERLRAAP